MYKIIVLFVLAIVSSYASQTKQYYIKYKGISVGTISDFSTINRGYLVGKPVGGLLGAFISFDNLPFIFSPFCSAKMQPRGL